ncbi:uncharacterized protein SPPG_04860 [Spizellomyces punctatus DAOM BR117]|uniref:BZIP domain-containing protein n=1 Tax=Spizellomyces punctatus (strain DAOM BR117) TaxID=645134 RepID=A0A0L0HHI8_SPIPD|nr:uncharacterized protein SPPG_04860 [Spizellomyces punctatus DAOM BR117]KND00552.1 hypothetical protein SPPG_04860 [Spizellomyces punctatus DAOM BR117]|eukprot:XP_016608591.1 hypothetical protein SPPG_04860 [Spizellomyces punctatus DAOM BR117]
MSADLLNHTSVLSDTAEAIVASANALQTPVDETQKIEFPLQCIDIKDVNSVEEGITETFQLHSPISPATSVSLQTFGTELMATTAGPPITALSGDSSPSVSSRGSTSSPLSPPVRHSGSSFTYPPFEGQFCIPPPVHSEIPTYDVRRLPTRQLHFRYTQNEIACAADSGLERYTPQHSALTLNIPVQAVSGQLDNLPATPPPSETCTASPTNGTPFTFGAPPCFEPVPNLEQYLKQEDQDLGSLGSSAGESSPMIPEPRIKRLRSASDSFLHFSMEPAMLMGMSPSQAADIANASSIAADIQRRRAKNTEAARRSRQKKACKMRALEDRCHELESHVVDLERRYSDRCREKEECLARESLLRDRISSLEQMLQESHSLVVKCFNWNATEQ